MRQIPQPGSTTRVSDNYATHLSRGSLGGTDFVDGMGTPVRAQLEGFLSIVDNSPEGSGGRYSRTVGLDGDAVESLHQSAITGDRGGRTLMNTIIGFSGASAYGSNTGTGGPHIHNHGVHANGVRFNLEPWYNFALASSTAGSGGTTPITPGGDDDMYDQAARDEVIGRIDQYNQERRNMDAAILKALGNDDDQVERILNAVRREARPRLYQINQPGDPQHTLGGAFDRDEGYKKMYGSAAEMQNDIRLGYVAPEAPYQLSRAEWDDLVKQTDARLAAITADPKVPSVTGKA